MRRAPTRYLPAPRCAPGATCPRASRHPSRAVVRVHARTPRPAPAESTLASSSVVRGGTSFDNVAHRGPFCDHRGTRNEMQQHELIYDWNTARGAFDYSRLHPVELDDETLRDGLQCPSVRDPKIAAKIEILHLMAELGIHTADIGLPGAGPRAAADVRALAHEIARSKLPIAANCAARTVRADVEPIARITQETGVAIEACTFIGSSPIRQYAEDWTLDRMLRST